MAYLRELLEAVTRARRLGLSALATVETVPPRGHGFPRRHPAARMNLLGPGPTPAQRLATYRDLERQSVALDSYVMFRIGS